MATVSETIPDLTRDRALALYRGMVLIRRCEEAAGPVAPAGLVHGACHTYVGQEGDRGRRLRASAAGRRGLQHASRPRPRAGQGRAAARADRRAVRPGDRLLARPRRQHAPVRAGSRHDGHQRHRRPVHPAGRRRRLQLQAAQDRPRGGRVLRRRRGQQRRVPRGPEPGRHLEAAGAVRLREQPVRHRGAVRVRRRAIRTWPPAGAAYGMPGVEVDGNDVLAVHEAAGEAVAAGPARRRADAARVQDLPHARRTPRAWATSPTARAKRSRRGRRAARSRRWRERLLRAGVAPAAELDRIDAGGRPRWSKDASRVRRGEPVARPATAADRTSTPDVRRSRGTAADRQGARASPTCRRRSKRSASEMAREPADLRAGRGHRRRAAATSRRPPASTSGTAPERLRDTPICERGFVGLARRRGDDRHAAGRRLHVRRLRPRRASARSSTRSPRCST